METASKDNKELAETLRKHADGARNAEHRPHPCVICDLATLSEEAARRLEAKS